MKNLYLLIFILAAGFMFTSCKKEDKKSPESSLMGKWKGEKSVTSASLNGSVVQSDTSYIKMPDYVHIEFKKNNQMVSQEFIDNELDTDEFYYIVKGNKISIMDDANDPDPDEYTFKVDKNKLILSNLPSGASGVTISSEIHLKR